MKIQKTRKEYCKHTTTRTGYLQYFNTKEIIPDIVSVE